MFDKTKVSTAVESTVAPVRAKVTPVAIVKFKPKAKVTIAREMDARETALFEAGEQLGYALVESDIDWAAILKTCKTHADRLILRAGFVSGFTAAGRKTAEQAQNRFSYLARLHSPGTSRKQGGKRKGAGAPEATDPGAKDVTTKAPQILARALAYVAKAQEEFASDDDVRDMLGKLAVILSGK